MRKTILTKNYAKAFKRLILLAVVLAVVTAAAVPLSLSRQIRDLSALEQTKQEETLPEGGEHGGHADREELWKSRITSLRRQLRHPRRARGPLAGPASLLLAAGDGLALQERGE